MAVVGDIKATASRRCTQKGVETINLHLLHKRDGDAIGKYFSQQYREQQARVPPPLPLRHAVLSQGVSIAKMLKISAPNRLGKGIP